jgi:hypothetical protein
MATLSTQSRRSGAIQRAVLIRKESRGLRIRAKELRASASNAVERGSRMLGEYLIRKNRLLLADRRS